MLNNRLLANGGTKLKIFEDGVVVNKNLPKWKKAKELKKENNVIVASVNNSSSSSNTCMYYTW